MARSLNTSSLAPLNKVRYAKGQIDIEDFQLNA